MQLTYTKSSKERLDKFIHSERSDISRNQIQRAVQRGEITVNGKNVTPHHWLKANDTIALPDVFQTAKNVPQKNVTKEPTILFSNDDFAIIVKPAGLLIHPTEKNEKNTLAGWIVKKFPSVSTVGDDPERPGIVHRLDKDVGGLVLVALTQENFLYFKTLFAEHTIIKKYTALVYGVVIQDEGTIESRIARNKEKGIMVAQTGKDGGKDAITLFSVVKRYRGYTLLDVQIVTGRTHQIRTHLYSIGHSIVGDPLYKTRDVRKKRNPLPLTKPFLFAYYLHFTDANGQEHDFTLDLPEPLQTILNDLS